MPYICNKCGCERDDTEFRMRRINKSPVPNYRSKTCTPCERQATKKHQQENREYWRELNRKSYRKNTEVGVDVSRRNVLNRSDEERAQRARDKTNRRATRAKQARFYDELTEFVVLEAHELRKLRNDMTGFEWHVDHIVPLKGTAVSGLHIWANLRVIPKIENLSKGAKFCRI